MFFMLNKLQYHTWQIAKPKHTVLSWCNIIFLSYTTTVIAYPFLSK